MSQGISRRGFLAAGSMLAVERLIPSTAVTKQDLGGGRIMCFANRHWSQMSSTVFVSRTGHLAVVDGGFYEKDGEFLYGKLKELGGVVDYWFITHPHCDHYGALDTILRKFRAKDLKIRKLLFNFPDLGWIVKNEPAAGEKAERFMVLLGQFRKDVPVHQMTKGEVFNLDGGVRFEVLNNPYLIGSHDSVNNLSVCLSVTMGGRKILVTGDLAPESGDRLMRDIGPDRLKHDICFLSHHGQQGVRKDFYAAVSPEVVIWPTPEWLWENRDGKGGGPGSGPFQTNYTKCWLQDLGIRKQYLLTKDYVLE